MDGNAESSVTLKFETRGRVSSISTSPSCIEVFSPESGRAPESPLCVRKGTPWEQPPTLRTAAKKRPCAQFCALSPSQTVASGHSRGGRRVASKDLEYQRHSKQSHSILIVLGRPLNQRVGGSSPPRFTKFLKSPNPTNSIFDVRVFTQFQDILEPRYRYFDLQTMQLRCLGMYPSAHCKTPTGQIGQSSLRAEVRPGSNIPGQ
jgi:hypothetical protein